MRYLVNAASGFAGGMICVIGVRMAGAGAELIGGFIFVIGLIVLMGTAAEILE